MEVDVFLKAMKMGTGSASAERKTVRVVHSNVRIYDFRSPDKFSKEQLRTLILLHENFARVVTTALSAILRTTVQMEPSGSEQCPYGNFARGLQDPTILGIIHMPPLSGNALIEIDGQVAFPMLDRMLGGPGKGAVFGRAVTDIESAVLGRIFHAIIESLREAWRNIVEISPRMEALETNPLFAQLISPAEMVAVLRFTIQVGEQRGWLKLCLPYMLLEPVLPHLSARRWMVRDQKPGVAPPSQLMAHHLSEVLVPLTAELGKAEITVRDLVNLETGDIISLDVPAGGTADVLVRGRRKFRGKPGTSGKRLAIQITEVLEGEGDE